MTNNSKYHPTVQENIFSKEFLDLISVADVETTLDSFTVFFHAIALEVGFLPKNVDEHDVYNSMPKDWKTAGARNLQYCHKSCPELSCWMTVIPFYSFVAIHGGLDNGNSQDNVYFKLKTTDYLNDHVDLKALNDLFKNTSKLVKKFKDRFCFPLLAELQANAGCPPTFGFCATVDEIKLYILQLLPVESVVSMCLVNKDCNRVANSPFLWKRLLVKDFGLVDDQSVTADKNYKQLYKVEFLRRKSNRERIARPTPGPFYPPLSRSSPPRPHWIDNARELPSSILEAFPQLRDRFRPNRFFFPYPFM